MKQHMMKRTHWKAVWLVLLSLCLTNIGYAKDDDELSREEKIEQRIHSVEKPLEVIDPPTAERKDYYRNREYAINEVLLQQAKNARAKGDYPLAERLYERVLGFAPKNQYALAGLAAVAREKQQARDMVEAQKLIDSNQMTKAKVLVHDVLLENPQHPLARQLNERIGLKMGDSHAQLPQLKAKFDKPVSLEFRNANIKLVFDALSRDTGINFILDKDVRPDMRTNINVKNVSIDEAIDTVISSNGLAKKVTSENTVIIFPRNALKLKAYEELLIRNFYLNNTKAKDVADLLKSMIRTKNIYVYERLNMLVIRDRPEVINLAEKLVNAMDLAGPEVMLEIEVLEVSSNRLQDLGIVYPSTLSVISSLENGITLEELKNMNSSTVGVSAIPSVNFGKTTGDVNLLSNPRIRVKNDETAKISVGDKVPVVTVVNTANVGSQQNVDYIDVGLKLEVEPHITLNNFVDIKVGLEVSTLGRETVLQNGSSVFQIGNRTAQTSLRLKDGETQVLAGLISDDDRRNINKLPGLGDIPLLGRLFSNNSDSASKTEIVLAITPRVLGNIPLPSAQFTEYWSGTANQISDKIKKTTAVNGGSGAASSGQPKNAFGRLLQQRQQQNGNPFNVVPAIDPSQVPPKPKDLLEGEVKRTGQSPINQSDQNQQSGDKEDSFIPDVQFLK